MVMWLCPKLLLAQAAHPQMQTGELLLLGREKRCFQQPVGWGWVSPAIRVPPVASALAGCSLAFPLPCSPLYPLGYFCLICCFSALPPTCILGSSLPMALPLDSLCDLLHPMYKIHLAFPLLFTSRSVLPCLPVSTMVFLLNK